MNTANSSNTNEVADDQIILETFERSKSVAKSPPNQCLVRHEVARIAAELRQRFGQNQRERSRNKVHLVRFADDFIVTGATAGLLEDEVQAVVEGFLALREAELSATKTRVTHINEGFDFLG